jgi:hypothetical protein
MAPHSQSSPFKFLELTPSQPSQQGVSQTPTVVKDTEMLMASPSQPATSTNFLELTCSAPTQPASSPPPTVTNQTKPSPRKRIHPKTPLCKSPELSVASNAEFANQAYAAACHVTTTAAASPRPSAPQRQPDSLESL